MHKKIIKVVDTPHNKWEWFIDKRDKALMFFHKSTKTSAGG